MSFLSPNQQCQSTEGNSKHWRRVAWSHPFFTHKPDYWWTGVALSSRRLANASIIWILLHRVSKKTSNIWLAIIFTHTVQLRQFLAQMLPRKYAINVYSIFPPRLTSASALPGKTGNPEIASFHLNAACLFTKWTRNAPKNTTWSELNHPSLSKQSTGCTRQDIGREHSILLSVTHMLCVSQVCHGVSHCVKGGSCSSSSLE